MATDVIMDNGPASRLSRERPVTHDSDPVQVASLSVSVFELLLHATASDKRIGLTVVHTSQYVRSWTPLLVKVAQAICRGLTVM